MTPRVLLFDLGNVITEWSGLADIMPLLRRPETRAQVLRRWIDCPYSRAFQLGTISATEFSEGFARDWDLAVSPAAFLAAFRGWSKRILPGAPELLAELRPRFRLAALSNSNEVHWARNAELGVNSLFEFAISSHEVGLAKPDPEIYRLAIGRLGVAPADIAFFDDLAENIDAAVSLGMRAFQTVGVDEIRARCRAEGWL